MNLEDGTVLVNAEKGKFVARAQNGDLTIRFAGRPAIDSVYDQQPLPGAGVLFQVSETLFLANIANASAPISPVNTTTTGAIFNISTLPGLGVLIWAENGWFLATVAQSAVTIRNIKNTAGIGRSLRMVGLSGAGVLIAATNGLFFAHVRNGTPLIELINNVQLDRKLMLLDIPPAGILVAAENGLFFAAVSNGIVSVVPVNSADTGQALAEFNLPGRKILIQAEKGWFLAKVKDSMLVIEPVRGPRTGEAYFVTELPHAGVLIRADNGWFLEQSDGATNTIKSIDGTDTGSVTAMSDLPGLGILIQAENGWYFAHESAGAATIEPAGAGSIGRLRGTYPLPGVGVVLATESGLYLAKRPSLSDFKVELRDRTEFDGTSPDRQRDLNFVFAIKYDCAAIADKLALSLRVQGPGQPSGILLDPQTVRPGTGQAEVAVPVRVTTAGDWSFQLVSKLGGTEQKVGEPQHLTFRQPMDFRSWLQLWGWWTGGGVALLLATANVALFVFARRSAWAWRLATDDSLSTSVLRIATLVMSHVPLAQVWILDQYFQRQRSKLPLASPFLPLPLSGGESKLQLSDRVIAPPWAGKRQWIQGNSGMGKTALFRRVTEAPFREHRTSFSAFAEWGCIIVPFLARDFAGAGEDKHDPAWVLDAVRATLSSLNLTFADDKLLRRFLESGTIGVAIDGLNEASRAMSVSAFSEAFPSTPMLVTSQDAAQRAFINWRLPEDIRAFTGDLLRLYLSKDNAATVMQRITGSGLSDALRSGYDVRLIIDLVRSDPTSAPLPADRLGLYAAVIAAGWPNGTEAARREQISRTAAAAWRMVSERKPNEDMRRLKPGTDLTPDLLEALASAPQTDGKPVRLIRRVSATEYEFVHDQMHAYLAAFWFTQDGFTVSELENMARVSSIWTQTPEARKTLWGFAATLLDDARLTLLWARVEDNEDWDTLRRALKAEAEQRNLEQPKVVV